MADPSKEMAKRPTEVEAIVAGAFPQGLGKVIEAVKELKVITSADVVKANDMGVSVTKVIKAVETADALIADPLYATWKKQKSRTKALIDPLMTIKKLIASKIEDFNRERIREQQETARRIQAEKDRLDEEERKAREKADADAREAIRKKAEAEAAKTAASVKADANSASLEELEASDTLFSENERADMDSPPLPGIDLPSVPDTVESRPLSGEEYRIKMEQAKLELATIRNEGSVKEGARMKWTYEVTDETQLPREYLTPDLRKLKSAVDGGMRFIEGVRIFEDPKAVFRG